MKPINVAILKLDNGHVPFILDALKADPLFKVCAVSYSVYNTERLWGHKFDDSIPAYYDDEELLNAHPEIEMAVCGGTNKIHLEQFRACATRGIHMILMKVPTMDSEEYAEMIRLQKEYGVECAIELEMRWRAEILRAKKLVESGAIGEVLSFTAYNYSHFPMWWNTSMNMPEEMYGKRVPLKANDPSDHRFRGGALTDHPHLFDMARVILSSEYKNIYAQAAPNMRAESEVEDMLTILAEMDNGVICSFNPSYANREKRLFVRLDDDFSKYPRPVEVGFSIHGTKGSIIADAYGSKCLQTSYAPSHDLKSWGNSGFILEDSRRIFLKNFARKIRGEKVEDFTISLEKYEHIIKVLNAAYESISSGKVIEIK